MKRKRRNRAFGEEVIATIERGEQTSSEATRRYDLHAKTLKWWRTKLRRSDKRSVAMVPVQIMGEVRKPIAVHVGDVSIELEQLTIADVALLVGALRA